MNLFLNLMKCDEFLFFTNMNFYLNLNKKQNQAYIIRVWHRRWEERRRSKGGGVNGRIVEYLV